MKQLIKVNNSELSFRLKLNYNNVYSRLRMLLGEKASLFADLSPKSQYTIWYADDNADYERLSEATDAEKKQLFPRLQRLVEVVAKELKESTELAPYVSDILEIPADDFIFYRATDDGGYKFIFAGWGCKYSHVSSGSSVSGPIRRGAKKYDFPENPVVPSKADTDPWLPPVPDPVPNPKSDVDPENPDPGTDPASPVRPEPQPVPKPAPSPQPASSKQDDPASSEPTSGDSPRPNPKPNGNGEPTDSVKKPLQHVWLRVLDSNENSVAGESVSVNTPERRFVRMTDQNGLVDVGDLPYSSTFNVSFPNMQGLGERTFEVEPKVEYYNTYIKRVVKYSPILFVENQHGSTVQNHDVKIMVAGKETVYNSGINGMIQLPPMYEGQKFFAIDTANYANTQEFEITSEKAKSPYHFRISQAEKANVGISVLDRKRNPISGAVVDLELGDRPCQQTTGKDGRVEFPYNLFAGDNVPIGIKVKGKQRIPYSLKITPGQTEYAVLVKDKSRFNWMWLGLLPLLALLAWGGYALFGDKTPTWEELNKGVVLIKMETISLVHTGLPENTGYSTLYFKYDPNTQAIQGSFSQQDVSEYVGLGWGTGFFISKEGHIATNRHVAAPIAPIEEITEVLNNYFINYQVKYEQKAQEFQKLLNKYSNQRSADQEIAAALDQIQDSLDIYKNMSRYYDQILKLKNYKVETRCNTYAAFDNSMIKTIDDQAFHPCTCLAYGEPGDVNSNDVAIIQLNEKEKIMPQDAYIFKVPEKDPFADNRESNEDYEVWVLGYNYGIGLAGVTSGIHAQHMKGNISSTNDKYHVQYSMGNAGGTSGGPVLNNARKLVGINNSGFKDSNIRFGVRTTYLRELMEQVNQERNNNELKN